MVGVECGRQGLFDARPNYGTYGLAANSGLCTLHSAFAAAPVRRNFPAQCNTHYLSDDQKALLNIATTTA